MNSIKVLSKRITLTLCFFGISNFALAQATLNAAQYTNDNELLYPANLDEWIHLGSSLGSDYNEEEFDPAHPSTLGVVQMEPSAYRYFLKNKEYADGTMLLLSFFESETKSNPQLQGFVQGKNMIQEIHVIDKRRFAEERGFFVFETPTQGIAEKVSDGSVCVECHTEHADYNGTFTQFYPTLRKHF